MSRARSNRRRVVWGVLLIAFGAFLLLRQLDLFWVGWGTWWPGILVVIGLVWMVAPESRRQIASGLTMILLGLWFFACTQHWYDLTYRSAWPLLLVIFGFEIVFKAVLERLGPAEQEERHA